MIQCIINEALIGVLGIQDICHFTFRDMGYFSFYFQVYGVLVILLQGIWDTVFIIFIYFQGYRIFWKIDYGDICQFIRDTGLFTSRDINMDIVIPPIQAT